MEFTEKDMSQFIIETIDLNRKPLKFLDLNNITVIQLLRRGYDVIVKEDEHSICSLLYSVVSPPKNSFINSIKKKFK